MRLREHRAQVRGGFTLMELMVVVMILVVLAGLAVPTYMYYSEKANRDAAFVNCNTIANACMTFKVNNGEFPASLGVLTQPQGNGMPALLEPRFLYDPWGKEYSYAPQGPHGQAYGKPDVWTTDPSGVQIGNWQRKAGEG